MKSADIRKFDIFRWGLYLKNFKLYVLKVLFCKKRGILFKRGHYIREDFIQGNTVIVFLTLSITWFPLPLKSALLTSMYICRFNGSCLRTTIYLLRCLSFHLQHPSWLLISCRSNIRVQAQESRIRTPPQGDRAWGPYPRDLPGVMLLPPAPSPGSSRPNLCTENS